MNQKNPSNSPNTTTPKSKSWGSKIYEKTGAKYIYDSLPKKTNNLTPFIKANKLTVSDCFNFKGTEDSFIKEFQKKIIEYKKKLKDDISYNYGKHRVFVNTYYLPIMYIIYAFIYKKFYDEQVKRQIIIYTIHKYNKNRLLFDKKSPLIKKVNVFLNTKLNEEKKEEKEELEGGIINQIIENKNILIQFLQEINEKLEKEIDINKKNEKKYTIFLNDLKLYKDKLDNIKKKIQSGGLTIENYEKRLKVGVQYEAVMRNLNFNTTITPEQKANFIKRHNPSVPPPPPRSINTKINNSRNISSIINNRLLNKNSNNETTTLIKSKYEDLIKLQTKINLFLITDNNKNTVNFLIKTANNVHIQEIIAEYERKIENNIKPTNTKYQTIIDINKELLLLFENKVELYQDYLLKINNKNVKSIFFDKIKFIITEITRKNKTLIKETENNNNLLQLLNFIYNSIEVNIQFEENYLKTTSETGQSKSASFFSIILKTTKIEFDEKLRHYLKEKKDTNKTIEKKLKEFKEDVEFNLKNISNELAQLKLKEALTAEEKKEKEKLDKEYKNKDDDINKANKAKSELEQKLQNLDNLSDLEKKKNNLEKKQSAQLTRKDEQNLTKAKDDIAQHTKLTKQIDAKNGEISKYKGELKKINVELTKLKKKENQYNYKKQILETKEASYKNIIIEIDANLKELTATKNATSNNTSLKDTFNKVYNNLSDLSNSLDKINKKIQFKQSENKILSLYDNDTIVQMINNTNENPIDKQLNNILKYFTVKKFNPLASNKNFPKINIFINSFIEEYNKIKDVHNINVELFFNFVFELNNELTTNIIFILEQIKQHNLEKKSFDHDSINKIKYLTDIKNSIQKFHGSIKKNKFTNHNKENKKSNSKIKKILAYTDVINLYLSNIIYLTAYLSTYYL
jgi:hypothetical protein